MSNFCKIFGLNPLISRYIVVLRKGVKIKCIRGYSSSSSENSKNIKCSSSYQTIADFYSGKSVLVTGGTGFLGKVYIEKLLYSCNKLDKIYLLVRDKEGESVNKRIEDLFANQLFSRLKKRNPDFLKNVVPITGDLSLPNLGLSQKDNQTLIDKVSVVYHAAATVKFTEPLPVAMNINFEGTQKMLELSRRMKNIEAFVYISTAYAHTHKKVLVETIYPPPAKVEDVYKFIEEYGHDDEETMKFITKQPNTYTFTKSLTEASIASNHGNVPTIIIRPSVVTPIKDGPIEGWLDNWYGSTPTMVIAGKGWNRISRGSIHNLTDFIPVDYVSNLSIIAAARAKQSSEVQVFNCTTSSENPVSLSDAHKYFNEEMISRGKNEMPYPSMLFVKSRVLLDIGTFLFQMTPAYIADLWLKMTGRKAKYTKLLSQVVDARDMCDFFTLNTWVMRAERTRELYSSLSPEDKKEFPCDATQIEWSEYFRNYCKGVLKYLKPKFTAKS